MEALIKSSFSYSYFISLVQFIFETFMQTMCMNTSALSVPELEKLNVNQEYIYEFLLYLPIICTERGTPLTSIQLNRFYIF